MSRKGEYKAAVEWLEKGIAIAERLQIKEAMFQNYESMVDLYKAVGDYERALQYHERFHQTKESVFNENEDRRRKNLLVKHEADVARADAEIQQGISEYFRRLNDIKDDTINTLSHDLKSPLRSISMQVGMLRRHGSIAGLDGERYLNRISENVNKMQDLIINLLDLARLETGVSIETSPGPVGPVVERAVAHVRDLAAEKRIHMQVSDHTAGSLAPMDAERIQQVLGNLLSNPQPDGTWLSPADSTGRETGRKHHGHRRRTRRSARLAAAAD